MSPRSLKLLALPQCPSCSSSDRQALYKIKDSALFQCSQCSLRYLDPCLDPDAMKFAYESNETLMEMNDFHEGCYDYGDLDGVSKTSEDFNRGLALIEKVLTEKGNLLDIGFGNGFFLAIANQRGWKVQGIDSSNTNRAVALKKFGLELTCAGFEDFHSDVLYDAIAFWDVVEHIPTPHAAIQKASQMLRPGGVILIGGPNDHSALALLSGFLYKLGMKQGVNKIYFLEHVSYYTLKTLNHLMAKNGFFLKGHFLTRTDLAKYRLPWKDKIMASIILWLGALLGLENRIVAVFQKEG